MESEESLIRVPESPVLKTTSLPDVAAYPTAHNASVINEETDISTLTNVQLYELNQSFLEDTTPQRPLIDALASISTLRAEYEGGSRAFVYQIDWLKSKGFIGIRRTRGDGDCFYRSLAFAYIEMILRSSDKDMAVASTISILESTTPLLEDAGFQKLVYEDFYDVFTSLINQVVTPEVGGTELTVETLTEAFQSPEVSNSIVVYLRLLTSAQIRSDPESYEPFLFHPELGEPMDIRTFCENFVEAVGKEADHVQVTALSRALKIDVSVAYLDGRSPDGKVDFVEFHDTESRSDHVQPLTLLYRPGHYDILDKRDTDTA